MTNGAPATSLSAFAVHVPEAEACVGELRARHDPSCALGVPAHVTILYPFMEPSAIDDAVLEQVREALSGFHAFSFRLHRIERFPGVLYLAPEPHLPMKAMTRALAARFPAYPPYGGLYTDVVPHLTVAQAGDADLDAAERELRARLPAGGLVARCAEVVLMENSSGLWRPVRSFPLAERDE
jgi:2'-5' RNA ligase